MQEIEEILRHKEIIGCILMDIQEAFENTRIDAKRCSEGGNLYWKHTELLETSP